MTLAHTTVELPKYGASNRDAAISMASDPAPATNTTAPRCRDESCIGAADAAGATGDTTRTGRAIAARVAAGATGRRNNG